MSEAYHNSSIDTELQVRLMNLVMGEASDFERDQLQLMMEQRPELVAYHQHLEHLHGLLSEVGAGEPGVDADSSTVDEVWQLPADRRDRVLAVLENRSPQPSDKVTLAKKSGLRNWRVTPMEAVVVASISFVLIGLMWPATQSARESGRRLSSMSTGGNDLSSHLNNSAPSNAPTFRPTTGKPLASVLEPEQVARTGSPSDFYSQPSISAGRGSERESRSVPNRVVEIAPSTNGSSVPDARYNQPGDRPLPNLVYLSDNVQYFPASPEDKPAYEPTTVPAVDKLAIGDGRQSDGEKQSGSVGGKNFHYYNGSVEEYMGRRGGTAGGVGDRAGEGISTFSKSNNGRSDAKESFGIIPSFGFATADSNGIADSLNSALESPKSEVTTWERDSDNDGLPDAVSARVDVPTVSEHDVQSYTVNVPDDGTILLGGIRRTREQGQLNRLFRQSPSSSTLMMTVTPRIIIPAEDFELRQFENEPPVAYPTDEVWKKLSNRRLERYGDIVDQPVDFSSIPEAIKKNERRTAGTELFRENKKDDAGRRWMFTPAPSPEIASKDRVAIHAEGKLGTPKQPVTLDEQSASAEAFSTFSLHVSDVSFKLAQAALSQRQLPEASKIRIEEFVNALDYHDPLPSGNQKVACCAEQAIHPFLMQCNLLRVSIRTAATGRSQKTPLRLTLLLDNSGSMERPDRRQAVLRAFQTLTQQLIATDQITLISFASTPRLLADKVPGNQGETLLQLIANLPSEGGTNIEAALLLAREKAAEQQLASAQNRIVLMTDGAVNLGDANPESLAKLVTQMRDAGIAFDAAGISAQDLNDQVLEALTRQGDGRYYLLDSAATAGESFAAQIAGSLRPSAQNVKVQVEFNPQRVGRYKLLGFEKHRLNKEDFRNDQVDAAEMAAAETGVAVYQFEIKPNGSGDVGSVSVRFRDLPSGQMVERRWPILYESNTPRLEQAQASMQLAASAALFAAKLGGGPLADSVDLTQLQNLLAKLPEQVASQPRVQQLRAMIEQAIAIH